MSLANSSLCLERCHLQLTLPGHVNGVGFQEGERENGDLLCMDGCEPLQSQ